MPHRKAKKPRGSRGSTPCIRDGRQRPHHDLMVLLPKSSSAPEDKIQAQLLMKQLVDRLSCTGFTTMAFTRVVYGRPQVEDGVASMLELPVASGFLRKGATSETETDLRPPTAKRSKQATKSDIGIVNRLHAVVENLSDVGAFTSSDASESTATLSLLREYDLVSLSPRNDATFQAACLASEVDIVTLDYTAGRGGIQIPFRIRPLDVKAMVERGAAFELHYAPALLNVPQRKALVQTARSLQMASIGIRPKPRLVFSSGNRTVTGDVDMGAMALRSPGDLINLLQTVLGLDASVSHDALGASGTSVLERGRLRKLEQLDRRNAIDVCMESDYVKSLESDEKEGNEKTEECEGIETHDNTVEPPEMSSDGFITL